MRGMTPQGDKISPRRELGARIEDRRKSMRLSKVKAGAAAGISDKYWAMFENGERPDGADFEPSATIVVNVANVVGIDPDEALRVYGIDPAIHKVEVGGRPPVLRQELDAEINQLDAEELRMLQHVVRTLLRAKRYAMEAGAAPDVSMPGGNLLIIPGRTEMGPEAPAEMAPKGGGSG